MFPRSYTEFIRKVDAQFANDPNGDFVMAEDVNELQAAIERLEASFGLVGEGTLQERLERLERSTPLRVPTILRLDALLSEVGESRLAGAKLGMYDIVFLTEGETSDVARIVEEGIQVMGTVSVTGKTVLALTSEIARMKNLGAVGMFLRGMSALRRADQQHVVDFIHESGLRAVVDLTPGEILAEDESTGFKRLELNREDVVMIEGFGASGGVMDNVGSLVVRMQGYLSLRRLYGVSLYGNFEDVERSRHDYAQGLSLVCSLDGIGFGTREGHGSVPDPVDWVPYQGKWATLDPVIEMEGEGALRRIRGGVVHVDPVTASVRFTGIGLSADFISFKEQSIDGTALKNASISKEKIASYDPDQIIQAINASATVRISVDKIGDAGGDFLPASIPAQNLRMYVIEAVNQRAGAFGKPEKIVSQAIESLDGQKLYGDIPEAAMMQNIMLAINGTTQGYIDVLRGDIETMNAIWVNSQNADIQSLIATESSLDIATTRLLTSTERLDAKDIFAQYIKTIQLETESLKVKDAFIEDLIAESIRVGTLDAVMAHIGTAEIDNLVAESIQATIVKAGLVTALNSVVGEATINGALISEASILDAQIVSVNAGKITAGSINTGLVTLDSPGGHLRIDSDTLRIYDEVDVNGMRRMRVLLGDTGEIAPGTFGLVVLGEDGTTRLYDNTGVYNAGIHTNAISNEKLQDDAIQERNIVANAITADKIRAGAVNAEKIQAGSIVAGSAIIAEGAIGSAQIAELDASKVKADWLEAGEIRAGSIRADHLSVGFQANEMKEGFDDFERFDDGPAPLNVVTPLTTAVISRDIRRNGTKSLKVMGNDGLHQVRLEKQLGPMTGLLPGDTLWLTAYAYTTDPTGVNLNIGLALTDRVIWGTPRFTKQADGFVRLAFKVTVPADTFRGTVALETRKANAPVYFDAVMIEIAPADSTEPSVWTSAATTTITGDMISTGTINAEKGITFQAGAVTINEDGITMQGDGKKVQLDETGLKIEGGGLTIIGGLDQSQMNPELVSRWDSASEAIGDLVDGNTITVFEKFGLEREWLQMKATYETQIQQATTYELLGNVRVMEYMLAKDDLQQYLTQTPDLNNNAPILGETNKTKDSVVDGAAFSIKMRLMYDKGVEVQDVMFRHTMGQVEETRREISEFDISPLYRVDIESSKGLLFRNGQIDTVLVATVWRGSVNITAEVTGAQLTWERISDDPDEDAVWNFEKGKAGMTVPITHADIDKKASFRCVLDLPETS